mgnify:CR=1 FL=1
MNGINFRHRIAALSATLCLLPCLLTETSAQESIDYACFGLSRHKQPISSQSTQFPSAKGLVMAGYQGWFNAEGDGMDLGWKHYEKDHQFYPGNCTIDLWPDVSEYEKTYVSPFCFSDGNDARLFSSHDRSTVMLHFQWMKDYGIDGAFMQRFVQTVKNPKGLRNYNDILMNARDAAERYERAFCVMYDLSGMNAEDTKVVMKDWDFLTTIGEITSSCNYLHHNGKPLVAIWGIGFNDNRKYGFAEAEELVNFFHRKGCSILLGVPTHWRALTMDTIHSDKLHKIIKETDIVHPWFVGRFNNETTGLQRDIIHNDLEWCKAEGLDYMPVLYPGFSWYNLKDGVAAPLNQIPRHGGRFFWKQVVNALSEGAEMIYLAMFDEIDEGTAFFKCANIVPVGDSPFVTYEGLPSDHYLWLAGMAGKCLRKEVSLSETMPQREYTTTSE